MFGFERLQGCEALDAATELERAARSTNWSTEPITIFSWSLALFRPDLLDYLPMRRTLSKIDAFDYTTYEEIRTSWKAEEQNLNAVFLGKAEGDPARATAFCLAVHEVILEVVYEESSQRSLAA